MPINNTFTVSELIELVAASVLAGLLTGGVLIYLYLRYEKRGRLRRHGPSDAGKAPRQFELGGWHHSSDGHGDSVIDIRDHVYDDRNRQTPTIPIQLPPVEEDLEADVSQELTASLRADAGSSHVGRSISSFHDEQPQTPDMSRPMPIFRSTTIDGTTTPPIDSWSSPSHSGTFSPRNSRTSRNIGQNSRYGRTGDSSGTGSPTPSTANLVLSRTTTNVSTLPPYDTLSSGPPRYPSSLRNSYSNPSTPNQPNLGPIPPLPYPDPWRTKQDGPDRF